MPTSGVFCMPRRIKSSKYKYCRNCGKRFRGWVFNFNDMENETNALEKTPTLWKWYFGWHPRLFLSVPIFLMFAYQGLWFIWAEIQDITFFFQTKPITWGAIFLIMFFGTFLIWFILAPIYICFASIGWLYQINIGNKTAWRKFLYTIGIILLVIFGTSLIRLFTAWILGILS